MFDSVGRQRLALAVGIAVLVSSGGASAAEVQPEYAPAFAARTTNVSVEANQSGGKSVELRSRYIIGLKRAPLAFAEELAGVSLPRNDHARLDVNSPEALSYVQSVAAAQDVFLSDVSSQIGRALAPISPVMQFQHAFNGMVVDLSDDEARIVAAHPDVFLLEPEMSYDLDTDAGPTLIGAPGIWDGSSVFGGLATRGEGVVIGVIDSGINIGSPSYAAVGPTDGYVHQNPLGSGNFLGWCNPSNPNHNPARDICNNKLIGGWDFADAAVTGNTTVFDAPGFEDDAGHGSHTSSTAAGNLRAGVLFNGVSRDISGVAPHANVIAYDVCHTVVSSGQGSCFNTATLGAINQVLADGIVDVVNYSISGGAQPWNEANSLAFLALHNAGVVVSASAGNSGPGPSTVAHLEPWNMTVGASSHTRVFGFNFSLTGPGSPPVNTQNITVRPGGAPIATATLSAPIIVSPNFANGSTDGCAPYPANFFRRPADAGGIQGIAVLQLTGGTSACASGTRRTAALAAGAAGVLFVDATPLSLGANGTTYSMLLSNWNVVAAHIATDPSTATATIAVPLVAGPGTPDVMAGFSSRGPNPLALLKPDITAPGLEILAAYSRWVSATPRPFGGSVNTGLNNVVNVISGTSMSAPHNAGAAALLRGLNRSWTPTQIKSALVTTAKLPVMKENGLTPSDPFDRGAGRIDLSRAAKAGLIMDETGANFSAANPAIGGDPSQLNLPSFQNLSCVGTCSFPRIMRSTRVAPVTWTLSVTGLTGASVSPTSFTVANSGTANFSLNVDSLQLPAGQVSFGEVVMTPSNPAIPTARMAIAVRPAVPDIDVQPTAVNETLASGDSTTRNLTVSNVGNPTLIWSEDTVGQATLTQLVQPNNAANGFTSNFYNNQAPTPGGNYLSDDHTPSDTGPLRTFRVEGFLTGTPANPLTTQASAMTFKVYADSAGVPAGQPEAGAGGEVYSCVRTPTGPNSTGLSFVSADTAIYQLDAALAATAGCPAPPVLQAGTRYWFVAFPSVNSTSAQRRWVWFRSTASTGLGAQAISPLQIGGYPTVWTSLGDLVASNPYDLAMTVTQDVPCGASWFDMSPDGASLGVAGQTPVTMSIDSTGLPLGTQRGFACFDTNGTDPDEPKVVVPVTLTVLEMANVAPLFAPDTYSFRVNVGSPTTTVVGTANATDADGDMLLYAITAGNTLGAFAIDPDTGEISVANGSLLGGEGTTYTLTVQATDPGDLFDTAAVAIEVVAELVFGNGFE